MVYLASCFTFPNGNAIQDEIPIVMGTRKRRRHDDDLDDASQVRTPSVTTLQVCGIDASVEEFNPFSSYLNNNSRVRAIAFDKTKVRDPNERSCATIIREQVRSIRSSFSAPPASVFTPMVAPYPVS